ncbi:MAG: B12-binding domain-containing radical SAM protein [Planctomycetia bacterium]|uniref:B12-binding domain-containing radical SAM protein n=2 Tax=Candidatus Brocadia sapporoensis TaxID=392547 RepID=A0A1V6LZE0_9BACT|nr:B12-binding domain-containing radical SAM protein [Candidatus Brocadia sp.]OQD45503.1 B12-binding domain-containing radical SAM protein [Candidatus Brocadia sapporoensis]QOJ06151.1 MAG: B12-binding domain-containing radical SAM protein [Planctomycetia bacterium]TVL96287.1 MAG: radical SAM protein [Candidatus Brocadia sp. BL1]MDG6005644.1 B12-binding domain-containing radical SAM protein [Candidatus Brocadia sp.]
MRILLCSMPDTVPQFSAKTWRAPNLAISSLAGNIQPHHDVALADLVLKRNNLLPSLKKAIEDYQPDIIGLSAMTFQFDTARRIAMFIKSLWKDIKIAIGGYHATLMYEEIASADDDNPFDYIVRGEGEETFRDLLEAMDGGREWKDIPGLSYRHNGRFLHNPPRPLENLDTLKLPRRDVRIWNDYLFSGKVLDMVETSRGCTMTCNFCSMNRMYGRTFRAYSFDRIMQDLANAKKFGAKYIAFSDDNITLNVRRFESLCDAIVEAGHNDLRYIVQASTSGIASSPTLALKMARAGIQIVFLGIENVSERNLKIMNKGGMLEKTKKAIDYLHCNNILIVGGMILGHAEDKEEDIAQNFEFFDKADIDFYGEQIITPYPKTGMRDILIKEGLVTNVNNYKKYNGFWANVKTKYLSSDDLQFLRWKYKRKYSTFFKTTPAFKANFLIVNLLRVIVLRPFYRIKNFFASIGKTERDMFEKDMKRFAEMNKFF